MILYESDYFKHIFLPIFILAKKKLDSVKFKYNQKAISLGGVTPLKLSEGARPGERGRAGLIN